MDSKGWHYYDNSRELESLFWVIFCEQTKVFADDSLNLINFAWSAGLFCRYGFIGGVMDVKSADDQFDHSSIAYLDAFCMPSGQRPDKAERTF